MTAQPHDIPNADLLERIPLSAQVVLDVGCSTGALSAAYRRFNPRARLLGIDRSEAAAAIARQRLDEVAVVDVEEHPLPFVLDRPIDCILYGDVLEHLRDPWSVLRRHAEALSDDGTMVICVPNLEHWSFADRLLRGTWKYESSGLLDDTHLRWFSLETMREGLEALGLSPCDVKPRIFDGQAAVDFATKIAPALTALGVDPSIYAQRAAPLQYVWRVRKRLQPRLEHRIEHVGTSGWRVARAHCVSAGSAAHRCDDHDPIQRQGRDHERGGRRTTHLHTAPAFAGRGGRRRPAPQVAVGRLGDRNGVRRPS